MELHGNNDAFGMDQVELSEKRRALPAVAAEGETAGFPCGVGRLIPIVTVRKDGSEKTVYAFRCPEGEVGPAEGLDPTTGALVEAVTFINRMLAQAIELSDYPFGQIAGVQVGVGAEGWGFTRVEIVPKDAHGRPSASPLHLMVETTDEPGCPESLNAVIEYNEFGKPAHLVMSEYEDAAVSYRVDADVNPKTGKFSVRKIERVNKASREKRLMYKRGHQPSKDDEAKRGGGRGGNRTGGRPGDRRPGDQGGRDGRSGRPGRPSRGR